MPFSLICIIEMTLKSNNLAPKCQRVTGVSSEERRPQTVSYQGMERKGYIHLFLSQHRPSCYLLFFALIHVMYFYININISNIKIIIYKKDKYQSKKGRWEKESRLRTDKGGVCNMLSHSGVKRCHRRIIPLIQLQQFLSTWHSKIQFRNVNKYL